MQNTKLSESAGLNKGQAAKAYMANRLYAAFICSKAMNVSTV
jgi:hypothetical protein